MPAQVTPARELGRACRVALIPHPTTLTCLTCDANVDIATQRLETADACRYRHLDRQNCQATFQWWRSGALFG